jgi:hypothetical protein
LSFDQGNGLIETDKKQSELYELKCSFCKNNLLRPNERFRLYEIPNDELSELDDNFWCHNHDHHTDGADHEHYSCQLDINRNHEKAAMHNMTLITLSPRNIDQTKVSFIKDQVCCAACSFGLGFTKLSTLNLWKTNVAFNNNKPTDVDSLFTHLEQGRYVFNVRKMSKKKLYVWIIADDLYFTQCILPHCVSLSMAKKSKKLLYNYADYEQAENPKYVQLRKSIDNWKNDINVDYIDISYEFYLILFRRLVDSTESLYKSLQATKNGFYVAIV